MMTTETPIDYENPWIFEGHPFLSKDIDDYFGFVYRITNLQSGNSTSEGSISGPSESLEVSLGELKVRATGKNTTGALIYLMKNVNRWGMMPSEERYSLYTVPKAEQTMKKPVNYF